jgi:hypothetical protein
MTAESVFHFPTISPLGDEVESSVVCVMTRFGTRRPWSLIRLYRGYRRVVAQLRMCDDCGYMHSTFLLEGPHSCLVLSFWRSADGIPRFGTAVPCHVDVARESFGSLAISRERGPELWSTKWQLVAASNNLNWGDFQLREALDFRSAVRASDLVPGVTKAVVP